MPKVSIIVPVYKAENYLHRCVDSILAQIFTDWELLLVDDGSPIEVEKYAMNMQAKMHAYEFFIRRTVG